MTYKEPDFIQWIRNRYCDFCGGVDRWDGINDRPINTPFHLKTRGSGGGDFDNCITACTSCHIKYENNRNMKMSKKQLANELTASFKMWKLVKNVQI
jgi:hypothetical protein